MNKQKKKSIEKVGLLNLLFAFSQQGSVAPLGKHPFLFSYMFFRFIYCL